MNFPMPLRDTFSSLKIMQTGCIRLNGATAFAVVRARHLQYFANGRWNDDPLSDLARIRRDHTFLRIFVNTAKAQLSSPLRINALVGGLAQPGDGGLRTQRQHPAGAAAPLPAPRSQHRPRDHPADHAGPQLPLRRRLLWRRRHAGRAARPPSHRHLGRAARQHPGPVVDDR